MSRRRQRLHTHATYLRAAKVRVALHDYAILRPSTRFLRWSKSHSVKLTFSQNYIFPSRIHHRKSLLCHFSIALNFHIEMQNVLQPRIVELKQALVFTP